MKKLWTLGLVAALALAAFPALGTVSTAKTMMAKAPVCKGRMAKVNVKTKTYVVVTDTAQKSTKITTTTTMCEAAAKAKGYHMMTKVKITKKTTMKAKTPMVNPSGNLNADKGATPTPDNNANGIHTTANPAPTPTP